MTTREIEDAELREIVGPLPSPGRLTRLGRSVRRLAVLATFNARQYHIQRSIPGIAGVALVSASVGGIFGAWYGLGALGLFCLRIDNRIE